MKLIRFGLLLASLFLAAAGPPVKAQTYQSLGSASLAVTSTTGNVALPAGTSGGTITILNVGTKEAFVFFGGSAVTAATTNESVPAGSGRCFSISSQTYVAAITAGSDTTTLRISQGSGPCAVSYRGSAGTVAGGVDVGSTLVGGGTTARVLYDNAGVLGEYAVSGTGSVCMTTSCSMTTPALGVATATSINGNTITTGTGTLTLGASKVATISNTLTFTGTDGSTLAIGTGGTLGSNAYTSTAYAPLNSPTLVTPVLGVATGTSLAIAGCTIGSNALCATGTAAISGNVSIGNTSPAGKLDVSVASNERIRLDDFGGSARISARDDAAAQTPLIVSGSTLTLTGTVTWGTATYANCSALTTSSGVMGCTASAMRYKIEHPFGEPGSILALTPRRYEFRDPATYGRGEKIGFFAEDVCKLDEALCIRNDDGEVENYDERGVIALLVRLGAQQQARIEALEARSASRLSPFINHSRAN